ncbi:metallophosphoesterase [Mycobacterium sp. CSUR Q5927]|nr:metallophosphoesterase [Mycobacterium sp. CSUR Q5927]
MADSVVQGYDIIGDIHGCASQLEALLTELGYEIADSADEYRHPDRQAIFVGDLIDRGDEQLRVLQVVKAMVDAGSAQIVMGNHEFNALAYHTESPAGRGEYLRSRSEKHTEQHQAFLEQLTEDQQRYYLDWFATFPLWLDLGGLRVVHACWHPESMAVVKQLCGSDAPFGDEDHLVAANTKGHPLYDAIENLLKGPEISLIAHGYPAYKDKGGHDRDQARTRWWDSEATTLRRIAVMEAVEKTVDEKPYPELPELALPADAMPYVYTDEIPVFYGHYWRQGQPEFRTAWTQRTACVDFSAVNGGALTAYRWSGETEIDREHYAQVAAPIRGQPPAISPALSDSNLTHPDSDGTDVMDVTTTLKGG